MIRFMESDLVFDCQVNAAGNGIELTFPLAEDAGIHRLVFQSAFSDFITDAD